MEISSRKEPGKIIITASMIPITPNERKRRFYYEDALEYASKQVSLSDILTSDDVFHSLTISNYREPYSGSWTFYVDDSRQMFKEMADKFEEKQLKLAEESDKLPKRKVPKKRKENE